MRIAFVVVVLIALAPGCGAEDSRLSSAELKVERVATADPVAGPVLHGDFVAWAEGGEREGAKRAPLVVFSAKPGEPRHILHRQGITATRPAWWIDEFHGSPQLVSFHRRWQECGSQPDSDLMCSGNHGDIVLVRAGGSTEVLSPPGDCNAPAEFADFAAHGPRFAWVAPRCQRGVTQTALWVDSADKRAPQLLETGIARPDIMLAGPFLARRRGGRLEVVDIRSRSVVYRVGGIGAETDETQYDLAPDGSLVTASEPEGPVFTRVLRYSADEPEGRRLDVSTRWDFERPDRQMLQVTEDLIAFERRIDDRRSELVVADDSGASRVIAGFDRGTQRVGELDFDGENVTWASRHAGPVGSIVIYRARLAL